MEAKGQNDVDYQAENSHEDDGIEDHTLYSPKKNPWNLQRNITEEEKNGEKVGQNQHLTPGKKNINEKKFVILCTNLAVVL